MNLKSPKQASRQRPKNTLLVLSASCFLFLFAAHGQTTAKRPAAKLAKSQAAPTKSSGNQGNQAEVELAQRIAAAQAARNSGDASVVALANQRLIALALRELAQLRLLQSAYPQAIELYGRSIALEDIPATHVDLAIAELQANHIDEAIAESDHATQSDSKDARAYIVRGRALMKKQDFAKAADAFDHATKLAPDVETFYSLGICLLQTKSAKDKERAAQVFQQMVKSAGDNGSLHVLFGRAYRDAEDMPGALREFQRALALDAATPHAHYFFALARMAVNEWKATPEIQAEFAKELQRDPHDYLTNYMLGFIASGERRYDVADRYLQAAVDVNPVLPEPWLYMGLNANSQGDAKRAEEMFRKAIALTGEDESRSNYQIRRAYVDLGRILATSGRAEESDKYLAKARDLQKKTMELGQQNVSAMAFAGGAGNAAAIVPLSPQNEAEAAPASIGGTDPFARVDASVAARAGLTSDQRLAADGQENRLRSVLGLGFNDLATSEAVRRDFASALSHYQEAEHWDPAIPGLAKNLGQAAFRLSKYPEAIHGLAGALAAKPDDNPVRAMLGMAYFGSEQYADVVKTFAPLGEAGMQDSTVGYTWAASLFHMGDLKEATEILIIFEKANQSKDALLLIGKLWIDIGDYPRAVAALHSALVADPGLLQAHYFAGQAEIRHEHWPEAATEFQSELALDPGNADAKYNLGFVLKQQSKIPDAEALFREVIRDHPDYANAHYELGKIALDHGQLPEAVDQLETAVRLSPQTDYMHYQLQVVYRKQSRVEDADRELAIFKEMKAKQREHFTLPPASQ